VSSKEVAEYVKWEHEYLLSTRSKKVQGTTIRQFRIEIDDPNNYKDNWEIFH